MTGVDPIYLSPQNAAAFFCCCILVAAFLCCCIFVPNPKCCQFGSLPRVDTPARDMTWHVCRVFLHVSNNTASISKIMKMVTSRKKEKTLQKNVRIKVCCLVRRDTPSPSVCLLHCQCQYTSTFFALCLVKKKIFKKRERERETPGNKVWIEKRSEV